jgi:hypothetical protein
MAARIRPWRRSGISNRASARSFDMIGETRTKSDEGVAGRDRVRTKFYRGNRDLWFYSLTLKYSQPMTILSSLKGTFWPKAVRPIPRVRGYGISGGSRLQRGSARARADRGLETVMLDGARRIAAKWRSWAGPREIFATPTRR